MKKFLFLVLGCISLHAEPVSLVAKVVPQENLGYFIFSDGTFWKVCTFVKRWRGPLEWITGVELTVPENYECNLDTWSLGDFFEAYPKYGNLQADESHASNEADIKKHSHLLVDIRTNKVLFATPIHPSDFTAELYNVGYNTGYNKGVDTGYYSGFDKGKTQGYDKGFSEGYSTGHDAGYRKGHEIGYQKGYKAGYIPEGS